MKLLCLVLMLCLSLNACDGKKLDGVYDSGAFSLEFKGGKVYQLDKMTSLEMEFDYKVDGNKLKLSTPSGNMVMTILDNGSIKGMGGIYFEEAKIKKLSGDFRNINIYLYAYQDMFKALPGDDGKVLSHLNKASLATTGGVLSNGIIDGQWNSTTLTDESVLFWQHIRLAGFAQGSVDVADKNYLPRNENNGRLGIQSSNGFNTISGMTGSYAVCSENILGHQVKIIDITMDDGDTGEGVLRAVIAGNPVAVATENIVETSPYTVCMSI